MQGREIECSEDSKKSLSTTILLKDRFNMSPISRSQAKMVCNDLDKFQEVILDFEELHWMGQGFAHQIFVVFAREHPEIRLVPVHMDRDVEKMYRHVMAEYKKEKGIL